MIDRRDFDEWWARETARNGGVPLGADYRHWAEAAFMAAQDMIRQQARHRSTSGYLRTLPKGHDATLPGPQLAALLVKRASE